MPFEDKNNDDNDKKITFLDKFECIGDFKNVNSR